jgi:two-component system KDP operon response regulator KdpE
MKPKPTALVIDDELAIRRLLRVALEHERYRVFEAGNGQLGLQLAAARRPDVLILEWDLPDLGGMAVLRSFREWSQTPVLVLSRFGGTGDKVAALDGGANDYQTKPFDTDELLARLRVLRRGLPGMPDGPLLVEGKLKVNLATHEATLDGRELKLTPTEESLFYLLVQYAGKVVTCRHFIRSIWGTEAPEKIHDLQVHMDRLRKKLNGNENGVVIWTEGSLGYRLTGTDGVLPPSVEVDLCEAAGT